MPGRFGRVLTAMATPFTPDGALDLDGAQRLARHLLDHGSDALVVAGTTGESPTLTHDEKARLFAAVVEAAGDPARVMAGTSTYSTAESVGLSQPAQKGGGGSLLLVTPYYKPPAPGRAAAPFHHRGARHRAAVHAVQHPLAHRLHRRGADDGAAVRGGRQHRRGQGRGRGNGRGQPPAPPHPARR